MKKLLFIILLLTCTPLYPGSPGGLDFSFNRPYGYNITDAPHSQGGGATEVALQSDGKMVVAGLPDYEFGSGVMFIARYNTDGTLDTNFGTNGIVVPTLGSITRSGALGIVIQSDDKIVVGGYALDAGNHPNFLIVRFTKDGVLDTATFNTGGTPGYRLTLSDFDAGAYQAMAWKIRLQSDGKIIAVGHYWVTGDDYRKIGVVRYSTNGTIDTMFGNKTPTTDGITRISETSHSIAAVDLAVASNNYLVIVGFYQDNDTQHEFYVVKLKSDGTLDTSFNSTGKKRTSITTGADEAYAVSLQSDGKIVAAGRAGGDMLGGTTALVRYNTDGAEDTTFGANHTGIVTTNVLSYSSIYASLIDTAGHIILAGFTRANNVLMKLLLLRYTSSGELDAHFGTNGVVITDTTTTSEMLRGLAFQSDGKIIASGGSATVVVGQPVTMNYPLRDPIYRDDLVGKIIIARYLNETTSLTADQLALARRLSGQWCLGCWLNSSVSFFELMQLKDNDFGAAKIRPYGPCCTGCA